MNILRGDVNFMVNRRVLIILEEGAQARLLACDHAMDGVNFLATQVVEAFIGENATFDFYELEETHTSTVRISSLYVRQEANSNVLLNGMTLHNGTTRNTTEVTLAGEGAELNLCGMAIADKNQHVDNNTTIDHAVPTAPAMNSLNMCSTTSPSVLLQAWCWYVPTRSIPVPNKRTVIFAPPAKRICTPSRNWRFTPMM